jgi:ATP-dependent RNA helicase DeaD
MNQQESQHNTSCLTDQGQQDACVIMKSLPNELARSLAKMGYKEFTEIQKRAIPVAMDGKDILGSAQTGTGKTAAFALPIAASLILNPASAALIITPTRELAQQVYKIFMQILEFTSIRCSLLIGGDSMGLQINQLKFGPRVIIGTPGRINDHLERRTLKLSQTKFLVLDETDRMLDMGFGIQINNIIPHLAPQRQTLLFSATISSTIEKLAAKYLSNPERISVGEKNSVVANIEQEVVHLKEKEKFDRLLIELDNRKGSIIVFVRTKYSADKISEKLKGLSHNSCAIHGDLRQNKRERVMHSFRTKKHRILVATDVAARGIDVPHIEHVINYDLTQAPEDFIHRLGRTARAGAKGHAVSFVSEVEQSQWRDIQRMLDPKSSQDYSDKRGGGSKSGSRRPSASGQRNPRSSGERNFYGDNRRDNQERRSGHYDKPRYKSDAPSNGNFRDKPGYKADAPSNGNFRDKPRYKSDTPSNVNFHDKPFGERRKPANDGAESSFSHRKKSGNFFSNSSKGSHFSRRKFN